MKCSAAAIVLAASGASAYSVNRSTIRQLGQKNVAAQSTRRVGSSMKMEDFGLFKNTGLGFEDIWDGQEVISEVGLENRLNQDGLRYRLNRTQKEADEVGRLAGLPGFTVNLPLIGETYLGPWAKIKVGVAKGKKLHDKRTDMKEKDWARDKARIMKSNLR